ncbi:MAG: C10 family peptidase [Bacteroidales bacterium]|nr:C10 family peptidase [Bacteroidales bacterium]
MKSIIFTIIFLWSSLIIAQVEPLVNNNWQTYQWPYNAYYPESTTGVNGHMGNGCWITAMSRVLHYWQFPENGNSILDFTDYEGYYWYCNYEELDLDYSMMPYELAEDATQDEYDQTAKLFYACGAIGASIKVGWEGGIDSLIRVLPYYLNYDTTLRVIRRWHYTKDEWIALFKSELDNGRPILIGGRTEDSPAPWEPGNYEGHFFVCDGYNADGKFYINYSFGGIYGYYDIDSMDMFPSYHEALINLKPGSNNSGVENSKKEFINVKIVPNPVTESSAIIINSIERKIIQIELYNLNGSYIKTIYKGKIELGNTAIGIKKMGLNSGIYLLKLSANGQSFIKKIVFR